MLFTAHHQQTEGGFNESLPLRPTHRNHGSTIWARTNTTNYKWLCSLLSGLLYEYSLRYSKTHAYQPHCTWLTENIPDIPTSESLSEVYLAMPDQYKNTDPVIAYRYYYVAEKAYFAKWQKGTPPPWWWPVVHTPKGYFYDKRKTRN